MKELEKDLKQDRPAAAFCGVNVSTEQVWPHATRRARILHVDLRGLRAALAAHATARA